ncbi:Flavin-linked sulfhydryl oxidase of the mitochondrial IMS, partial [Elasticomyces elasticus]
MPSLFEEQDQSTPQAPPPANASQLPVPPGLFPHALETYKKDGVQYYEGKPLPKGVVLGKDGKPCKTCTSSAAWMSMMKGSTKAPRQSSSNGATTSAGMGSFAVMAGLSQAEVQTVHIATKPQCPPDVEELGRSSWTLLHSLPTNYPERADRSHQQSMSSFLKLFSKFYPCWVCADDFSEWMQRPEKDPDPAISDHLASQEKFGRWLCDAHNEVNVKLGKKTFDCNLWKGRWIDAELKGGD